MSKVFTSIAVSIDGFIASKAGDNSWLNSATAKGEDYGFEENMSRTGILIMGANTYREMIKSGIYRGKDQFPTYVVTREKDIRKGIKTHLYEGDLKELTEKVKSETDKDIYIWGGGSLITQFIDLGLLDEMNIALIPVLLGEGIPLFGRLRQSKRLELLESKTFEKSGIVLLNYRISTGY